MAMGPDGLPWTAYFIAGKVGTTTNDGTNTDYVYDTGGRIAMIAQGPDAAMYFPSYHNGISKIIRLAVAPTMDGMLARTSGGAYRGGFVYNQTGDGQTWTRPLSRGDTTNFYYRAINRGPGTGSYKVSASAPPPCFRFRYFQNGQDVTDALEAGRTTLHIVDGVAIKIRIEVKAKSCAVGTAVARIDVIPTNGAGFDRTQARVTV